MDEEISNKKKKSFKKEMSFWDHLEELRWHLIRIFIVVIGLGVLAFLMKDIIFDVIILGPKDADFLTYKVLCKISDYLSMPALCMDKLSVEIRNFTMSGQFLTHMYVSIVAGIIVAVPYILWELWRFINPALTSKEQKYSGGAVIVSSLLFLTGVMFSYYIIVPLTINFLGTYQVSDDVPSFIGLNSYIKTVVSVTFSVGIVFELPVLVFFLTKIGILTPDFMKKNRKIVFVLILVLSAIITPPDVFSQILVCIPLIGLYELSIYISR
ncbi:twin-arginine translocase subunit TatC, partial [Bacteroidota bacterium]